MKKLVVLISVLALMAIALPVMASDVTLSGTATYGAILGQDSAGNMIVADAQGDATVGITAKADANNTVNVEFTGNGLNDLAGALGQSVAYFDSFYLQSDIGGALNLGSMVDPVLVAGYTTAELPDYSVTAYGSENLAEVGVGAGPIHGNAQAVMSLDTSVNKMFNILLAVNPETLAKANTTKQFIIGAYGTVGPVSVEAGLTGNDAAKASDGAFVAAALVDYTVSSIELKGTGQLFYDLAANSTSSYSAGLSATYNKMATVAGGLVGNFGATSGMSEATADVSFNAMKALTLQVGTLFNLASGAANVFDTLDASAAYTIGATTLTAGYIYSPASSTQATLNGTGPSDLNAPTSGQNGVYLKASLAF